MQKRVVTIGILGVGNVGTGVARVFLEQAALLTERTGIEFRVKSALDLDWERERGIDLSVIQCTTDVDSILSDPEIDIVVETIGGEDPAFDYIMRALDNGKHVVTANKALVAAGAEICSERRESNVDLLFEASVGGESQ